MGQLLTRALWALRRLGQNHRDVRDFKTSYWQSEAGAAGFVRASDGEKVPAAALMDAIVNARFLDDLPAGGKVLDVGCGHGILSLFLARKGLSITSYDVSQPLLRRLVESRENLPIQVLRGDVHRLPIADNQFDAVVGRMFLGHFPDWREVLQELSRCCRPGGKLIFDFTSQENADLGRTSATQECVFVTSPDRANPGAYFAEASLAEIEQACAEIGLRLVKRAATNFFLHNRVIGHALGTRTYRKYQEELQARLAEPAVQQFVAWFESTVVQHLPVWATYYNIVVLEKRNPQ